ncbi:ergosterol biosynthesis ERG4/ERG24 family protein [Colletotrichum caudatum]|nr:ergosterol biosynthesis ERG4/ERG24 family protein [Colletotrichum caudatum]
MKAGPSILDEPYMNEEHLSRNSVVSAALVRSKEDKVNNPTSPLSTKYKDCASDKFEFGGSLGTLALMIRFPLLMWYMWIGATYYDGRIPLPRPNQSGAYPTAKAWVIYWVFFVGEALMYCYMPGVSNHGRPLRHEGGERPPYHCSAYTSFYATLAVAAVLHVARVLPLCALVDEFGSLMTVAVFSGFVNSFIVCFQALARGRTHQLTGYPIYNDFFMGAELDPRIGISDFKMFYEVRVPWFMVFLITCSVAARQYARYGHVFGEVMFLAGAHYLYANACAKAEQMIIASWDMYFEKLGFLLTFWNVAGVPFTYCHCALYLANQRSLRIPLESLCHGRTDSCIHLLLGCGTAPTARRTRSVTRRGASWSSATRFPKCPWQAIESPKVIETDAGDRIMVDGWFAIVRKPDHVPDMFSSSPWGLVAGLKLEPALSTGFYFVFFMVMIIRRTDRDINRCRRKYGEAWKQYEKEVPCLFVPYII